MLLILKILLVVASYVFIFFTKKHMWARILSLCTGISFVLWMIIPRLSSEIPKMSDLWQSILWVTVFILGYVFAFFMYTSFDEDEDNEAHNVYFRVSAIGLAITFVVGCIIGIIYYDIYQSNIKYERKVETNIISSVTLVGTNVNSELSGKLEGSVQSNYLLFAGATQVEINGALTTERIIEYWYYGSDGSVNPGSVPKESIKIFFIEDAQTPHMDTHVTTTELIKTNYNKMIMTTYGKQEVARTHVFYVPKGSILEQYDFN